eukprot:CAMPEP_0170176570 /NCGR_PEP_ID=MMETSP0040_2-20121228/9415_1 /TAXON_ID=641309 /ORGANISM="Lotharella oceanica, Strain CCMP622" /LENGTH=187 /DNA_ID=CAMNT_0010418935 /DNA_START=54 /DNA_END=617 /DNA_ORIENTATION=+
MVNPDVTTIGLQTGFYVLFAIIAYFVESGQEFKWRTASDLRWVILDTFVLIFIYGLYRFREGLTHQAYDIESKKDTPQEPLVQSDAATNAPALIRNAERTAGNTAEQLPLFILSMWLYGNVRPVTAGVMGGIELLLIALYPFLYGTGKKHGALLPISTIPRYIMNEYMAVASVMTIFGLVRKAADDA